MLRHVFLTSHLVQVVFVAAIFFLQVTRTWSNLYVFTGHVFASCGASGKNGPTETQCETAYSSASWEDNNAFFTVQSGVQIWTVPKDAGYYIYAYGAKGGGATHAPLRLSGGRPGEL